MENNYLFSFNGRLKFKTNLSLEGLAELISINVFQGIPFIGKDQHIYEEVPSVFIIIFGWQLILQQSKTDDNGFTVYYLNLRQFQIIQNYTERIFLNDYMEVLFKEKFKDVPEVEVIGLPVI